MLTFAKIRRFRSTAVFVLLGWIFALMLGSAYGCTPALAGHDNGGLVVVPHGDTGEHQTSDHAGPDPIPCQSACELPASPVVKEAAGQAPDMQLVALYTAFFFPAFYPPENRAQPGQGDIRPPLQPPSLRSTRLTL